MTDYTKGEVPPGLMISGVSTLYGSVGEVKNQWVKTKSDLTIQDVVTLVQDAFANFKSPHAPRRAPESSRSDLLTVYPLADLHLGMYSWKDETGSDYDLSIASDLLRETAGELVGMSPNSETGLILNLGDFFHADNSQNRTMKSHNILDVDTRYAKVLKTGVNLMIDLVQAALAKHQKVIVRNLPGNHDEHSALALSIALEAFFRDDERVQVLADPSPFFWYRHGKVLLGAAHGDRAKPQDMIGIMAAKQSEAWGQTKYRYNYLGHIHKRGVGGGEIFGAQWETFQTISPKDAWSNTMGFTSGRSMVSITHHAERGELSRVTMGVRGPE